MARSIIRKPEVRRRVGLSDSQIWRLEKAGLFPARVQLGIVAVGWNESEIDQWVENRPRVDAQRPSLPKAE